jgi:PAS domain S-box-containing protein
MAQLAVSRDATRRKLDESARAHLAAIIDSSDDAIVSKTLDGIIQSWNAGAQRIFGYTAEEAIGRPVLMLLPTDRKEEEAGILARLRAGERVDHFESIRVTKDGHHINVSLTISPVRDSKGRIIGASKVARDITRQKQSERDLQIAKRDAEDANRQKDELLASERHARGEVERAGRMKDEFLANLSHELRTPLNAILGWAQILGNKPTQQDLSQGIEIIERNARSQVQIIEDLLDMSRIISGKIRLEVQRFDLATVVRAAVETVKPAAEAKGVRLHTVLDALASPVSGDPNRLQQVFWNLLTNAIKFTPKGGRVQVLLERVNSHLEVSVIDSGEGIAPEFLPYVFDRFRQADAGKTRRHSGLGLGLAIVKQLVELHGGTVRAKSGGAGQGSTFIVSLPLTVVHPEFDPEGERRHPTVGKVPLIIDTCVEIEGVKVLIVDDEPDARMLVKRVLEDCQAVVSTASSAAEATELLKQSPPDIIISDIGMPGEDGYAFIKRVRGLSPDQGGLVPAIALTAYARAEDRMAAMLAGFEQYLVKPVEPAELITLVSVLVRARRRSR